MACIEASGLRKAFGPTIALDGIDLRVEEGRILGLFGPNGAG
jgi:ABC-type multidrug transport system ATPase subunit